VGVGTGVGVGAEGLLPPPPQKCNNKPTQS